MDVTEALKRRISVRAFAPTPVPEALLRSLLETARWAPSGGNLQAWRVIAVAGDAQQAVTELAARVLTENPAGESAEFPVYPPKLWEPYRTRRFELGEAMYEKLGIGREDKEARLGRFQQNYAFFGAPVGLFFVLDRRMGHGQWAHMGMLMQSIALAALDFGLGTCMQEAWAAVRTSLGEHFGLAQHELLYCGMALGYPDWTHPVNTLRSKRIELDELAEFRGFAGVDGSQ